MPHQLSQRLLARDRHVGEQAAHDEPLCGKLDQYLLDGFRGQMLAHRFSPERISEEPGRRAPVSMRRGHGFPVVNRARESCRELMCGRAPVLPGGGREEAAGTMDNYSSSVNPTRSSTW